MSVLFRKPNPILLRVTLVLPLLGMLLTGCATHQQTLRVALFPYIPDAQNDKFSSLTNYLENAFERANPRVDLQLRRLNPGDEEFYDAAALTHWLTDSNTYDVVEIDTLLLGDLVRNKAIEQWSSSKSKDWYPVARESVTIDGVSYGIPHLLCGHFIFSKSQNIADAKTASQLVRAVESLGNQKRDLDGNFAGSWNLPALYLDAWEDTFPGQSPTKTLGTIEEQSLRNFTQVVALGNFGGSNACLNGGFDYPNAELAADMLARDEADVMIGYSERLHRILQTSGSRQGFYANSAPLGNGTKPILFADALVLRRAASKELRKAATRFAEFLTSPEVQERLLMSTEKTSSTAVPRYLLPATKSAYRQTRIKSDPFYRVFQKTTEDALPYPNSGFPAVRKQMQQELNKALANN